MIAAAVTVVLVVGWTLLVSRKSLLTLMYGLFLMMSAVGILFFNQGLAVTPSNALSGHGEVEIAGILIAVTLFLFLLLGLALTARMYLLKKNSEVSDIQNLKNT
jgi:hypothetical protein